MAEQANTGASAGFLSEGSRWPIEKCALPFALMAGPFIFQSMAANEAAAKRVADQKRASAELAVVQERERAEQKFQLYINLLSKCEESDTTMRLGLFSNLIGNYLERDAKEFGKKLTQLELLLLNFHDSLNLNPLFWELQRRIGEAAKGPGGTSCKSSSTGSQQGQAATGRRARGRGRQMEHLPRPEAGRRRHPAAERTPTLERRV